MRFRGTLITAACATAAGLGLAGCGGSETSGGGTTATATAASDVETVRKLTRGFLTATAAGTKGTPAQRKAACATLRSAPRAAIEAVGTRFGATGCEATLERIGTLAGADQYAKAQTTQIEVTTSGNTATAVYAAPLDGDPTTVKFVRVGGDWLIDALPAKSSVTITKTTATAPATTTPATTASTGDPAEQLAARVPPKIKQYCKAVTDLPPGVEAGLTCQPFTTTEVNYALFDDIDSLNEVYANSDDGGPKLSDEVAGTKCKTPTSREGTFSNQTFGIGSGRVRCWTLSDGRPRFQWFALEAGSPLILVEATESKAPWGSLYRVWSEEAGPLMNQ